MSARSWMRFARQYFEIQCEYARLAGRSFRDKRAEAIVRNGFFVEEDWYDLGVLHEIRSAFPDVSQLRADPQSSSVYTFQNAAKISGLAKFFEDPRIKATAESIIGQRAELVRDWAQLRRAHGGRGSFDEFYHLDSFKHRLKAFLYLTDVGPGDGTFYFVPTSARGAWRFTLASELYDVERRSQNDWRSEDASYQSISAKMENCFAGCLTHYRAETIFRKNKLCPIPIYGRAGTMVMWDSRYLHKHEPSTKRERLMLESVWARAGSYG